MAQVQQLLTKGNEQYNSKQYQEAINIMNQVLKLKLNFSDIADASYLRARCYALLGNESSALTDLQTALEFNENFVNSAEENSDFNELKSKDKFKSLSTLFKGILKYYDGDYETGLDDMEEAIKQDSSFSTYFVATNSRANALWGLERYDKAIELFREAEFHAADSFDKYTGFKNLACILSELERYQESMFPFRFAIQSYQVAEKEGKFILDRTQLSPVYEEQGWALIGIDDYPNAITSFNEAKTCDSNNAWAIYGKAYCLAALYNDDSALENLKLALSMEPEVEEDVTNDEVWNRFRSDSRFEAILSKQ